LLESVGFAVVLAAMFALVVGMLVIHDPRRVSELTLVNESEYDIKVYAADGDHDGWSGLPTVERESSRTIPHVIDHGDEWVFAVNAQGRHLGELTLTRDELEQDGWQVEIPPGLAADIRDEGVPGSP
jgi:hypothetical protein